MNIRGRIVRLEQRRRGGVDWTDCPDPCHLPADPTVARPIDYRDLFADMPPTEDTAGTVVVPSKPLCSTCGEPANGLYIQWVNYYALPGDNAPDIA